MARGSERFNMSEISQGVTSEHISGTTSGASEQAEPIVIAKPPAARVGLVDRLLRRQPNPALVLVTRGESSGPTLAKPVETQQESTKGNQFTREEVLANASLGDEERKQAAANLLFGEGKKLTTEQQQALQEVIDAHKEALGELGEDETPAGVYNYKQEQIWRKARKLPSFSPEQRRKLMEAGLVGVIEDLLKAAVKEQDQIVSLREALIDRNENISPVDRARLSTHIQDPTNPAIFYNLQNEFDTKVAGNDKKIATAIVDLLKPNTGSVTFFRLHELNKVIKSVDRASLPTHIQDPTNPTNFINLQIEFDNLVVKNNDDIERVILEAVNIGLLEHLDSFVESAFAEPKPEPTIRYGANPKPSPAQRVRRLADALANYKETFWDFNPALTGLKKDYAGIAEFIAGEIVTSAEKDLAGAPLSLTEDKEFIRIKNEDEVQRKINRERATPQERVRYNEWTRRFEFEWAENIEELEKSVFDWIERFEEAIPKESPTHVNDHIRQWRTNGIEALDLALKNLKIEINSPDALRLKATLEAYVAVLGGVKLLELPGGFEAYTGYLEEFGYNFNAHNDSIYLGNAKSAVIQHFLSRNDGEIARSGDNETIKPGSGDTKNYREPLEERAKEYAATHQLYITDKDFRDAESGIAEITIAVKLLGLATPEEEKSEITKRVVDRIRKGENSRYGWNDDIEFLLLYGGTAKDRQEAIARGDIQALSRMDIRGQVFQDIKNRHDKEDGLFGKSDDERKTAIRATIRDRMKKQGRKVLLDEIDKLSTADEQDRELWKWVKSYNKLREKNGFDGWYPSGWDTVRLSINKPTKLVDRALSEAQLEAMIEEVQDEYKDLTDDQIIAKIRTPSSTKQEIQEKEEKIKAVLFDRQSRKSEADRAFNINRSYQKFLGVDARWGGMVAREIGPDGKVRLFSIEARARDILRDKINNEEKEINNAVDEYILGFDATHPELALDPFKRNIEIDKKRASLIIEVKKDSKGISRAVEKAIEEYLKDNHNKSLAELDKEIEKARESLKAPKKPLTTRQVTRIENEERKWIEGLATYKKLTPEQIESARIKKTRSLRKDATFGATLALREIGMANDLPIWDYYFFSDQEMVAAFAPLVGYTDGDKPKIADLLDKGRRELRAVYDYLADTYMDGKILVIRDDELIDEHQEDSDRARVVNKGGSIPLRDLFESRFMISTSGGVELPKLISKIADLGIYDLLWEMGCQDFREFQGFIKRRDEVELRKQTFWNIDQWKDPTTYAQRLRAANVVKKFLTGGKIEGQGSIPGMLNEPMSRAYRFKKEFYDPSLWLSQGIRDLLLQTDLSIDNKIMEVLDVVEPNIIRQYFDKSDLSKVSIAETKRKPTTEDDMVIKLIPSEELLKLIEIGVEIIKPLIDYLNARQDVVSNRGGRTPNNFKLENELIIKAYLNEMLDRDEKNAFGDYNLQYSEPGRSKVAVAVFKKILKGSTYHGLSNQDIDDLDLTWQAEKAQIEITDVRARIKARGLPPSEQTKINNRVTELNVLHPDPDLGNITKERKRLENLYIEEQVQRQVPGMWAASFAHVQKAA